MAGQWIFKKGNGRNGYGSPRSSTQNKLGIGNRPDIVVIEKKSKTCYIIDVACPFDARIEKKKTEKKDASCNLKYVIFKFYKGEVNKVFVIPIIIRALGLVTKRFKSYQEQLKCDVRMEVV